jgi:4-hydroxy-tetrahydrodipicolinate synthase
MSIGRHVNKLLGYACELPTPFTKDDRIDSAAFERLCELQIMHGASALVVGATTGEESTLSPFEHGELIRIAVAAARRRLPVIAGAGSNATAHAVEFSRNAEAAGADAVLSVAPYYNKPTQEGLCGHYREIAALTGLPIILDDVPSRTARGLADETVARLAEVPHIIGLKDATGDAGRASRLRALIGSDFRLLSGDDATALGFLAQGGDGCISLVSNIAPGVCRNMYLAWKDGNVTRARRLSVAVSRLAAALLRETNPAPLKYGLSLFGLMSPRLRLPLVEPSGESKMEVERTLARLRDEHADSMVGHIEAALRESGQLIAGTIQSELRSPA